jgi:hypothetical protein
MEARLVSVQSNRILTVQRKVHSSQSSECLPVKCSLKNVRSPSHRTAEKVKLPSLISKLYKQTTCFDITLVCLTQRSVQLLSFPFPIADIAVVNSKMCFSTVVEILDATGILIHRLPFNQVTMLNFGVSLQLYIV